MGLTEKSNNKMEETEVYFYVVREICILKWLCSYGENLMKIYLTNAKTQ